MYSLKTIWISLNHHFWSPYIESKSQHTVTTQQIRINERKTTWRNTTDVYYQDGFKDLYKIKCGSAFDQLPCWEIQKKTGAWAVPYYAQNCRNISTYIEYLKSNLKGQDPLEGLAGPGFEPCLFTWRMCHAFFCWMNGFLKKHCNTSQKNLVQRNENYRQSLQWFVDIITHNHELFSKLSSVIINN